MARYGTQLSDAFANLGRAFESWRKDKMAEKARKDEQAFRLQILAMEQGFIQKRIDEGYRREDAERLASIDVYSKRIELLGGEQGPDTVSGKTPLPSPGFEMPSGPPPSGGPTPLPKPPTVGAGLRIDLGAPSTTTGPPPATPLPKPQATEIRAPINAGGGTVTPLPTAASSSQFGPLPTAPPVGGLDRMMPTETKIVPGQITNMFSIPADMTDPLVKAEFVRQMSGALDQALQYKFQGIVPPARQTAINNEAITWYVENAPDYMTPDGMRAMAEKIQSYSSYSTGPENDLFKNIVLGLLSKVTPMSQYEVNNQKAVMAVGNATRIDNMIVPLWNNGVPNDEIAAIINDSMGTQLTAGDIQTKKDQMLGAPVGSGRRSGTDGGGEGTVGAGTVAPSMSLSKRTSQYLSVITANTNESADLFNFVYPGSTETPNFESWTAHRKGDFASMAAQMRMAAETLAAGGNIDESPYSAAQLDNIRRLAEQLIALEEGNYSGVESAGN
jgi:hypothetical protein